MIKIKPLLHEMNSCLEELSEARTNIRKVSYELEMLDRKYQRGEIDYKNYTRQCREILTGKNRSQISENYSYYISSLKKRLRETNSKAFNIIYNDTSFEDIIYDKASKKKAATFNLPEITSLDIYDIEIPALHIEIKEIKKTKPIQKIEIPIPKPEPGEKLDAPHPVKLTFFERFIYSFSSKNKPWVLPQEADTVFMGGFLSKEFLDYLFYGKEKEENFGKTKVLRSILSYEQKGGVGRDFGGSKTDVLDPYLLEKEIKEIKNLISRKRPDVYKASTLGYLANISVRKITIFFIEQYPDFFKALYRDIRYANIRVLANTYINIVFFLTLVSGISAIPIFTLIYSLQGSGIGMMLVKTFFTSIFIGGLFFAGGVYYPSMKAKSRKRSINTNIPFAIDHMSSVISSGVSPATMFKLISNSREYGEISVEIDKVSNYVEFFGYDVLTSLKAVALTTPSEDFKEFIDGFVSTIETGGNLKQYLSQKSSEALLNYRLERQKYVEALSTYSDIYTGVLIAAPLFFVIALSLVSVIGGNIGGFSVSTIISFGTYGAIPVLNLLFLIFLEASQPEI